MWWLEMLAVCVFAMGWFPCCCDTGCTETCANCNDGKVPCEWQIDSMAGFSDRGFCTNCTLLNATHVIAAPGGCIKIDGPTACSTVNPITVSVLSAGGGNYQIEIKATTSSGGTHTVVWRKTYTGTKPDCLPLVSEELPFITDAPGLGGCGFTGTASVFLTALT